MERLGQRESDYYEHGQYNNRILTHYTGWYHWIYALYQISTRMISKSREISERIVSTAAEILDKDPMELPPLEYTISGDALDELFCRKPQPAGAYTVFPYCGLWIAVHSTGAINVFETYHATTPGRQLPDEVPEPTTDDRIAVLHFENERYIFSGERLDSLHQIIADAPTMRKPVMRQFNTLINTS